MLTQHQTKIALGCEVVLMLTVQDSIQHQELFDQLWLKIFQFEQQFSRFLPASELSQFNARAGIKQPISKEFQDMLSAAKAIGQATDGLYNPFILPALQRAGYKQSMVSAHQSDYVDDYQKCSITSIDNLEIGEEHACIPYGTAIDLGGCGKGYLADRLSDLAETFHGVQGYWFSLGGDIIASGLDENDKPWEITVETVDTQSNNKTAGHIEYAGNSVTAVATSATTARRGTHRGKSWHHIIDPTTGQPAKTDILAATVQDSSAFKADVLASCIIITGSQTASEYIKRYQIDGLLIQTIRHQIRSFGTLYQDKNSRKPAGDRS